MNGRAAAASRPTRVRRLFSGQNRGLGSAGP
jgi:hypothetical protein